MVESLLAGTHGIRRRAQGDDGLSARALFAADTASALAAGVAVRRRRVHRSRRRRGAARFAAAAVLLLTGGARRALERLSRVARRAWFPDLVLRGLARVRDAAPA